MTDKVVSHHMEGAHLYGHLQALSEQGAAHSFHMSRFTPYTLKSDYSSQTANHAMLRAGIEPPFDLDKMSSLDIMRNYLTPERLRESIFTVDYVIRRIETKLFMPTQYAEDQASASNSEIMQIISLLQDNILMNMLDIWTYACAAAVGATRLVYFNLELIRFTDSIAVPPDNYWGRLRGLLDDHWRLNSFEEPADTVGSIFPKTYIPEADQIFHEEDEE
ncbi:MAG: hypothetical protein Q9164_007831 [Protoblastenia rupestris]